MAKYSFQFGIRLACEDYASPEMAGDDHASALATVKATLIPMWNHKMREPLDYDRDIAPRINLAVTFAGYDRVTTDPYACAEYMATVTSDDLPLLRNLRRYAAEEWNDGELRDYPILQAVPETDDDLRGSNYANCAACGFCTDRAVERGPGRFLCVRCDEHEYENG